VAKPADSPAPGGSRADIQHRPDDVSTTADPEALLRDWARGTFEPLDVNTAPDWSRRRLRLQLLAPLSVEQDQRLREQIAAFLVAYGRGKFEDYLAFRAAGGLAAADDPRATEGLHLIATVWDSNAGPPPDTPLGACEAMWKLYVGQPPNPRIAAVDWERSQAIVRAIRRKQMVIEEWDERAGIESHLYKQFVASRRSSVAPTVWKPLIPNHLSIAEIVKAHDELLYADVEVMQRDPDGVAFPILLRLVWDGQQRVWVPLNGMTLYAGRWPFVW
jgi:hypothetical protein